MFQQDMRRLAWLFLGAGIPLAIVGLFGFVRGLSGNEFGPEALGPLMLWAGIFALFLVPAGLVLLVRAPTRPLAREGT